MTKTGTGKVAGYKELGTEDCPGLASVPMITYLQEQLSLRDAKIVAMERSISQLIHAVRGLQQRWWQPVLIINMPGIQQQFEPLGSYCLVWAKKVTLAAICLDISSASFGIRIN